MICISKVSPFRICHKRFDISEVLSLWLVGKDDARGATLVANRLCNELWRVFLVNAVYGVLHVVPYLLLELPGRLSRRTPLPHRGW